MHQVLRVNAQTIVAEKVIARLVRYRMLTQFLREVIIDQAIGSVPYTAKEQANDCQPFYEQYRLTSDTAKQEWLEQYSMKPDELESLAARQQQIEKFKQATWGKRLGTYFLSRKASLDTVIYSLIQIGNAEVARELYFRLESSEQSFAEIARSYSQGVEAKTGGLVGPIELGRVPPQLAKMLRVSYPGQLWHPTRLGDHLAIVRLEVLIPACLDEAMRQRLLNELFESWLETQLVELVEAGLISLD